MRHDTERIVVTIGDRVFAAIISEDHDLLTMTEGYSYQIVEYIATGVSSFQRTRGVIPLLDDCRLDAMRTLTEIINAKVP